MICVSSVQVADCLLMEHDDNVPEAVSGCGDFGCGDEYSLTVVNFMMIAENMRTRKSMSVYDRLSKRS